MSSHVHWEVVASTDNVGKLTDSLTLKTFNDEDRARDYALDVSVGNIVPDADDWSRDKYDTLSIERVHTTFDEFIDIK